MRMLRMALAWLADVWRLLIRGRLWVILAGGLIVIGCTGPDGSLSSPHGYVLDMDVGAFGFKIEGAPSILQVGESALHSEYAADGSAKDMPSTYVVRPDGTVKATGVAATWMARAVYCRIATCDETAG